MTDNPRRFAETLGSGEEVHAHWGGRASDVHEKCRAEIERLRRALDLAIGELSTNDRYRLWNPEQLRQQLLDEAVRGE